MMETGNFAMELAETRVLQERDSSVARVRADLGGPGSSHCEDCGGAIPEGRRLALPAARRCIDCATARERAVR